MTLSPFRLLALSSLALLACPAFALDTFYVVKLTEMDKSAVHSIMSPEEYKELEADVRLENSLFFKAEEQVKKAWKAGDEENPFPGSRLGPRKIEIVERHTAREKADAKLEKLNEAEDRKTDSKKPVGKLSDAEKKQAEAKAEKERDAKKAQEMLQAKLDELKAALRAPKAEDNKTP